MGCCCWVGRAGAAKVVGALPCGLPGMYVRKPPTIDPQEDDDETAAAPPHWPALVSALGPQLPPAAAAALLGEGEEDEPTAPAPVVLQQTLQVSSLSGPA